MKIRFHSLSHDPQTHRFAPGDSFSGKVLFEAEVAGRWQALGLYRGDNQDEEDGRQRVIKQEVLIDVRDGGTVTFPFSVVPIPEETTGSLTNKPVDFLMAQAIPTKESERRPAAKKIVFKTVPPRLVQIHSQRITLSPPPPGFWVYLFAFLGISLSSLILADRLFILPAVLYWGTYIGMIKYWKKGLEQIGAIVVQSLHTSPESLVVEVELSGEERTFRSLSACYEVFEEKATTYTDGDTGITRFLKFRSPDVEKMREDFPYRCDFRVPPNLPLPGDAGKKIKWRIKVRVRYSNLMAYTYEGKLKVQPRE